MEFVQIVFQVWYPTGIIVNGTILLKTDKKENFFSINIRFKIQFVPI
jgi:hypothetical protein